MIKTKHMKIARVKYKDKEYYCEIEGNILYVLPVERNNLGIENFFANSLRRGEKLSDINDEGINWLPPIARPSKIICVGRNYVEHAKEGGNVVDKEPLLFTKFATSMVGHLASVPYPPHTNNFDYEVELAVIIGKSSSEMDETQNIKDIVFGYTVANDLTARDVQKSDKQWTRAKGFDNSLPIGPHIITNDDVTLGDQDIWLYVNGEPRQSSKISLMIHDIPSLLKYITKTITLEPGDILLTGTPAGVGYYMEPKSTLQKGDHVRCGITEIGELGFTIK